MADQKALTDRMHEDPNPYIHWPAGYTPGAADLFVHNERFINAAPSTVWRHLVEAPKWPEWYPNSQAVGLLTEPSDVLQKDSRFEFDTFGTHIAATIDEFEPERRLGWFGFGTDITAYHTWLLIPLAEGCQVVTEVVAKGPGAVAIREPDPEALYKGHDLWLSRLKQLSER